MSRSTFFDQYPDFDHDPATPIEEEFQRLAELQGWRKKTTDWKINRGECLQAEFELHLGSIEVSGKLAAWQALCRELDITGDLSSITKCKK
ncbi:MAG: hypothetical protein Q9224_006970, partial [Gallowayella concinna]